MKVEPPEEDFDPEEVEAKGIVGLMAAGAELFDHGRYLEAHEEFEKLWKANEAADAEFFKGLVQASMCLHHFQRGNLEGARKLYSGHRRYLAAYLPRHRGLDVERLLTAMQASLRPVLRAGPDEAVAFELESAPRLGAD